MRPAVTRGLAVLVALPVLMAFWWTLLAHNLARGEALFAEVTAQEERNGLALSADFLEYRDYYRNFPTRFSEMTAGNTIVEYYKRPLYGPISATLSIAAHRVARLDFPASMFAVLSLYAALSTLLLFALMRVTGQSVFKAVLLTALGSLSFSWLSVFSLPESYSLSTCAALVAALSGMQLPRVDSRAGTWAAVRHAIVSVVAAWVYLPAGGAVLLIANRLTSRRQWLTILAPLTLGAVALAVIPQLLPGIGELQKQIDYTDRWTSLAHFVDLPLAAQVAGGFLFFCVVSPVADFLHASADVSWSHVVRQPVVVTGIVALSAVYVLLGWRILRNRGSQRVIGSLLWFVALFLFHLWYNPHEVLLYLAVPAVALLLLIGQAFATDQEGGSDGKTRFVLPLVVVLIASSNVIMALR